MSNVNNRVEDEDFSCPSFSSYSLNKTAEIANKVTSETPRYDAVSDIGQEEEDDEDFEFSFYKDSAIEVNVSSEEDLNNGQNQIFPVFDRHILLPDEVAGESQLAVPFITLLNKEKSLLLHHHGNSNNFDSCSDELENIPSGTYCVWRPNKCKKSQSAGSASRRWASLRDLMRRSNSEGMKDSFVFLTPKKNKDEHRKAKDSSSSAHEELHVRNRAAKEGDKKKSYLPYRKELVGFFVNGNRFLPHV